MRYLLFFLLPLMYSCKQKQNSSTLPIQDTTVHNEDTSNPWQTAILPDPGLIRETGFGEIEKTTTYTNLEKMFGKKNLLDSMDYGAEGMDSFIVTRIFSGTPKELIVKWQMGKFHKAVSNVDCVQENSPYHTADGLQVGSTLEKLLQVNGKKIKFYGTGWDYGGLITSYNNGKFEKSNIFFSLDSREGAEHVMGDSEFNTDMPAVKANMKKIFIARISVSFSDQ